MSNSSKAVGLTLLILFLAAGVWVIVYFGNLKPAVESETPYNQIHWLSASSSPLIIEQGTSSSLDILKKYQKQ